MAISYKPIDIDGEIEKVLSPKALELYKGLRSGIIGGWAVEAYKNPEIQAMLKKYGVTDVPSLSTVIEKRMPRVGIITTEQLKNIDPNKLPNFGGLLTDSKNRSLISQNTTEGNLMREKYLINLRATLERRGANEVIDMLNTAPQLFTPETITNYTTFAQDPLKYPVDTTRPVGQSGAVLEQPLFGGGTDTGTAPADWKAQLVKAGGIAPSDTTKTNKLSQLDQQLLDAAKKGRKEFDELYGKIQNDFNATYKNINSYDFTSALQDPNTVVDYGGGYKVKYGGVTEKPTGNQGGAQWDLIDLIAPDGTVTKIRHTDRKSTASQIKNAITQKVGTGLLNSNRFNDKMSYLSGLANQVGDTTFSKTGVKGYWDKQYDTWRTQRDSQNYGTFIAPQTGKQVVMHTPEDLKNALVLGFKKVKDGTTPLKGDEINMISEAATTGSKLQANLEAYLKANPPAQGVQQTYDPKTGKTTYGTTTQPMGDAVYRVNGKLMSAEAAKAAGVDITKLTPESGSAYVDKVGTTSTPTSTSSTTTPTGTIPGMKNIFTDKKDVLANDAMVNQLFKAYHGRDANLQELNYWRTKKIGDLENTLAKTQIFSKEDADKIRAQMQAEGKTYIANQAELESLAQAGKITPAGLTSVSQQGGMLFQGTPTTTSGGTGTGGTGTGGATGTGGTSGTGTGGTGTGTTTDGATGEDALIETIANAVGDPNAADTDILAALNNVKNSQIDPYYKQLISQAQKDVMTSINRQYEDRIRQLQTESFNMAENIKNTQKSLEQSGMTFSGDAIAKLGTLAAFGQSTPAGLTPAQLDQNGNPVSGGTPAQNQTLPQTAVGLPTMTAEQMGLEGSVNMQNRLYSESSRSLFNRGLEDTGQAATRLLGTQGVQNLGLPSQATAGQPQTTGTMQYDYANTLQNTYGNLAAQEGNLTDYQKLFL